MPDRGKQRIHLLYHSLSGCYQFIYYPIGDELDYLGDSTGANGHCLASTDYMGPALERG